jgi:hypothetical protein
MYCILVHSAHETSTQYFSCSDELSLDPTISALGHVTPSLYFCIWWDLRVTWCILVHPGSPNGEGIPTPNSNEIVVLSSFFQRGFYLPTCEFLCGLLHHYEIELVHLNPNSILQIAVFVQLCKAFLGVPPNSSLFKSYFLMKYQPSADKWKIISGVGLQTRPHNSFLDLPMKTLLNGWHKSYFFAKTRNLASRPSLADSLSSVVLGLKNPHLLSSQS